MRTIIKIIILIFLCVPCVHATDWYVLKSASGSNNGTDWTNAWNEMNQITWASVAAGDTIWLGGGTYTTQLAIAKSGTDGSRIYIKRVRTTDAVPAAAAGWNAAFDAQVIINKDIGIKFPDSGSALGSYVTIDGRIDQGIQSVMGVGATNWNTCGIWINNNLTGVVLQYIDVVGPAPNATAYTHTADTTALQIRGGYGTPSNLTVRYCRFHGTVTGIRVIYLNGGVFEYNKIYDTVVANYATYHNNSAAVRVCYGTIIWRYNEIYSGDAEGFMLGATAGDTPCANEFYGNIMHSPGSNTGNGVSTWRFVETQYVEWPVKAYNNTLVDLATGFRSSQGSGAFAAGSEIRNNLFVNVTNEYSGVVGDPTISDNIESTDTTYFTDYAGDDYTLAKATTAGYSLNSPYNLDKAGNVRGDDGTWDIGAYEYDGEPAVDSTPPTIPAGGAVIDAGGDNLILTFDEAVNVNDGTDFVLACDGGEGEGLAFVSGSGTSTLIFNITGRLIDDDEGCTLTFDGEANDVEDLSGNDLADFTGGSALAVTNNSTYSPTAVSYTVSITSQEGCTPSPLTSVMVATGETTQVTCTPMDNYECVAWTGTCGGAGTTTLTTSAITADCTVVQPCRKLSPDSTIGSGCAIKVGSGPAIKVF
jgi:hypothetical protein